MPNAIPNNELLDFLSRVPSDSEQVSLAVTVSNYKEYIQPLGLNINC